MTSRWDALWPAREPSEDFALRVVVESVQARARSKSRVRWLFAAIVPSLCLALATGVSFRRHQEDASKRAAILEAQRKETEDRLRRLQSEFEAAVRHERELQLSLANANDEVVRTKLQSELEQQRARMQAAGRSVRSGAGSAVGWVPAAKKASKCSPGDPLCGK